MGPKILKSIVLKSTRSKSRHRTSMGESNTGNVKKENFPYVTTFGGGALIALCGTLGQAALPEFTHRRMKFQVELQVL